MSVLVMVIVGLILGVKETTKLSRAKVHSLVKVKER